MKKDRKEMN
ncbi:mltA-interacting protein, partial [Yersinia pestis PY-88]